MAAGHCRTAEGSRAWRPVPVYRTGGLLSGRAWRPLPSRTKLLLLLLPDAANGVGPPDRSRNHPAFCQLEFAAEATGVASHGRTKSPLGSSDFDTSEEREGKSGATD